MEDPYHIELIRDKLMKSLAGVLPDVIDELSLAVPEFIRTGDDGTRSSLLCRQGSHLGSEWVKVNILSVTQKIIARASNRVFVGPPACASRRMLSFLFPDADLYLSCRSQSSISRLGYQVRH